MHDLDELASHSIMLKLITQQLPGLMAQREQGRGVNAATLCLNLFDAIGERDTDKHIIRLSHKQQLLAAPDPVFAFLHPATTLIGNTHIPAKPE